MTKSCLLLNSMIPVNIYPLSYAKVSGRESGSESPECYLGIDGQSFPAQGLGGFIITIIKNVCACFHVAR